MKTTLLLGAIVSALVLALLPAKANLVSNGDFNTGDLTSWWTWSDPAVSSNITVLNNVSFSYDTTPYAYETARNPSTDSLLGQDVSGVAPGSQYQVSLVYRANNWGGAGVGIHYLDSSWSQIGWEWAGLYTGNGNDTGWVPFTSPVWTAPAGTAYVEVRLDAWGWSDTYYDNVDLSVVPEPSSAALLGGAGLVLLLLRRRYA